MKRSRRRLESRLECRHDRWPLIGIVVPHNACHRQGALRGHDAIRLREHIQEPLPNPLLRILLNHNALAIHDPGTPVFGDPVLESDHGQLT